MIRLAKMADMQALVGCVRAYLAEQEKEGAPVRLTPRSLDFFRDLLRVYLGGTRFGAVIVAEEEGELVGLALTGERVSVEPIDDTHGKVLVVWIAWVREDRRKEGLGLQMLQFGTPVVVQQGFETAVMHILEGNPLGQMLTDAYGAEIAERTYRFSFKESADG